MNAALTLTRLIECSSAVTKSPIVAFEQSAMLLLIPGWGNIQMISSVSSLHFLLGLCCPLLFIIRKEKNKISHLQVALQASHLVRDPHRMQFTPFYTLFLTLSCLLSKQCHSHTQHKQGLLLTHTDPYTQTKKKKKHVLNCNAQAGRWVALIFCEQYSKTFPASLSLVCRIYIRVHPAAAPPDRPLRVHYMSVFPPHPVILNVCGRLWFRWLL